MHQGVETFNSHKFGEYCVISLDAHKQAILDFLHQNTNVRILDVGCGTGAALEELRKYCRHYGINGVQFFGLDTAPKPENFPDGMTYIQADISQLKCREEYKFDLVISVNTFHYVENKDAALCNIATLLSLRGKAYISIEPYYFGPHGVKLFDASNCCQWDRDYRNLLVSPQQNPVLINSAVYFSYAFPAALESVVWRNEKNLRVTVPAFYTPELVERAMREDRLVKQIGRATGWHMFEFLDCQTPNPKGPRECGREGFRPFQLGVIDQVWLLQEGLSELDVIVMLIDSSLWDKRSLKQNFHPSDYYEKTLDCMFRITAGDNVDEKYIACRDRASVERSRKPSEEGIFIMRGKNITIVLGVGLFLVGLLLSQGVSETIRSAYV